MLDGDGLRVRDFSPEDMLAYRHWLAPEREWHLWDGPYFAKATAGDIDRIVTMEEERVRTLQNGGGLEWPRQRAVIADRDTDQLIGTLSWYYESPESDWRRVGMVIYDQARRGKGLGLEALRLWTSYLFDTTNVRRLDLATWSGNVAMCRVAKKLRWREEARFRQAREVRGAIYDSVVYGVLRSEWNGREAL